MAINPEEWFGKTPQDPNRTRTMWVDVKDPGLREVLGVPEGGMPLQDFLGFQGTTAQAPPQTAATPGFVTSVKRGTYQTGSDFASAAQLFGHLTQMPEFEEYWRRKSEDWKTAAEQYPRAVPGIENIHSPGDFGMWAIEQLGEQVPIIASFVVPGGIAAKAVGAVPKVSAAVAAGTGALAKAPAVAGWTAGFLSDLGLLTGESVGMAREAGEPIDDLRVIGSGLGKAMLDFVPFWTAARQLGIAAPLEKAILKHAVGAGYLKRAAGNAAVIIASEVPTETAQEWINNELDNYFTGYDGPITEEQKSRLYNAAAGASLFGVLGVYAPKHPPPPGISTETEEERKAKQKVLALPPPPPKTEFRFEGVPLEADPNAPSGFDFRNLYDAKTGGLKTTAADYLRIVKEQTQVKYDPLSDTVKQPPSSATYTTITPGWQERGGNWYLDAPESNVDAGKAQIVPSAAGFEAWDVYGNPLGAYPDLQSAMIGATQAVYAKGKSYVFDADGMHIEGEVDGHTAFVQKIGQPVTPIEIAATAIEQTKPKKAPSTLSKPTGEAEISEIVNDAGLMQLIDARNEFVNNKDNYRTDGEMKKAAVKKLAAIDSRIARYTQMKGVANVNAVEVQDVTGEKIDERLGEVANEEAKAAEAPLYPNLTPFEQKVFAKLNEKEMYEGLTDHEQKEFERLLVKSKTGADKFGQYEPAPPEVIAEFSEEEQKLIRKASKHRKKYSKATQAIAKMRGIQTSKGPLIELARVEGPPTEPMVRPGWTFAKNTTRGFVAVNEQANAIIAKGANTYQVLKVDFEDTIYDVGTYDTLEEALAVGEGASPTFVAEVTTALANFWRSFNIRPRLIIVSTNDILNNKVSLTRDERETLLTSHGLFVSGQPGTVMIHIDPHQHIEATMGTLVHEMIGHFGLRALLPVKYWDSILTAYAAYNRDQIRQLEEEGKSEEGRMLREIGDTRMADILTADEAISYVAMKEYTGNPLMPFEQNFLDRVVAQVRAWFRWAVTNLLPKEWQAGVFKYVPFNRKDVVFLLKDTATALRTSQQKYVDTSRYGRVHIQSSKGQATMNSSVESFSDVWGAKLQGFFLQAMQFAERYNLPGVADYMQNVQSWAARKTSLQSMPVELVERWSLYNKGKSNKLAKAMLFMTGESDSTGHALDPTRRAQILKEHGVDEEGVQIYEAIRQSFLRTLDYLEHGLIRQEIRRHVETKERATELFNKYWSDLKSGGKKSEFLDDLARDPKLKDFNLGARLNSIASQINALRDREYFPYMRFGRYAIWIRAKTDVWLDGKKYQGPRGERRGQMVHFETFETFAEMQKNMEELKKEFSNKNYTVGSGYVSDQEYTMLGMPPALYDTLRKELKLDEEQLETLKEIYYTKSPGQRFLQNMVSRRGIRGFSTDAIRVYSTYMMNAATHIARIEYGQDLDASITAVRNYAQDAGTVVPGIVRNYWENHYNYIMNPENDWAGLRAVGFMWYLGFNVKSAAVNLTQVPMVALPYLGARFGDTNAAAAITKAYKNAFKIMRGQSIPTGGLDEAIQQGIKDGFLDESLATILAGFSESSVLQRMMPETDAQRRLNQIAWAGAWMFRHVEKLNRYVTFLAARDLALQRDPKNFELAYAEAKEAVQSTMFEYAKWNRAPYMQGKKSVFFLFWSYMQGLAYLMAGGKGKKTAMRVWMMMLLAAGLQGVPFAENILDLIDWSSKEVKEALGYDDPYTDTRTELRKLASTITDNPDMLLHGWSRHYGLGPLHLLALAGVPVPEVDTSGSMSAGRWLPGTDKLTASEKDPDKLFGRLIVDILGPVAGVGYGLFSSVVDDNPDTWKKWERAMPSAIKGMSQGLRRGEKGGEEFRGGGKLAEFDPTNDSDRIALALNMLAFQPTKVGQAYEVIGAKENLRRYWTTRSAMVMENWAFAKRSGDPELMADAKNALEEFNAGVPDASLRLNPEKIRRSMKARAKRIAQREMGLPNEKGYRRLYEEIDQIYGKQ